MKKNKLILLLSCTLSLCSGFSIQAQDIKKSTRIEKKEDQSYYIHKVEKGQTIEAIAKTYGVKVDALMVANPEAIDGISPGQELRIPIGSGSKPGNSKSPLSSGKSYVVKEGDTYYSISAEFQVWVEDIKKINPQLAKEGLKSGVTLRIPDRKKKIIKDR
ncbi:MAG TPA: LysM peptidoglycan-binding domain-containing protein [Bacteroidia bacterium]|jgi:LysM repeat protein|nr:LysM peptidoglycan-binding domain-containing protein [Bacteroidia bacterium]